MNLVLLGAPGAGKGTQAERLSRRLNIPAISTGNMLRSAVAEDSPLGRQVQRLMERGELVPDRLILDLVRERIAQDDCVGGFLLDGVPRTRPQAMGLAARGIRVDLAILLEVEDETVVRRMEARRVCGSCGASYHLTARPPKISGVCDRCGNPLVRRADDAPDTVRRRLELYHEEARTVEDFYRERNLLRRIGPGNTPEEVEASILAATGLTGRASSAVSA